VIGGLYAAFKQTTGFLLKKQAADPEIKRVIVEPNTKAAEIAVEIPGNKIVVAAD
jgi:murein endopeptidase